MWRHSREFSQEIEVESNAHLLAVSPLVINVQMGTLSIIEGVTHKFSTVVEILSEWTP